MPSPAPAAEPALPSRRRNGSKIWGASSSWIRGPTLLTARKAASPRIPVATWTHPPGGLCRTALSTRFATSRSSRMLSPEVGAACSAVSTRRDPARMAGAAASSASSASTHARLGLGGHPTEVYLRTEPDQVQAVDEVLPFTVNPAQPEGVQVSRPSQLLAARTQAGAAVTGLFLALGAVAVLVGGVGVANIMVISVLERRSEIGLRRALGATRRQVGSQFLAESVMLSALGGVGGVVLGAVATTAYALASRQSVVVPMPAIGESVAVALSVGLLAGVYPAVRAARLTPTEALRAT